MTVIIIIFIIGYIGITLEHSIKIDKLIPALAMMTLLWSIIAVSHLDVFEVDTALKTLHPTHLDEILLHHLGKTAEILIFLIGAMTIVEIIEYFNGFATIKSFIKTKRKKKILLIISILAFFLSAMIDNLTATIVLITILQKLVADRKLRLWYTGFIIIAANAGGAWSPIGDVTTTMLWIADKVTTPHLITYLFIPSLICLFSPLLIGSFLPIFKGTIAAKEDKAVVNKKSSLMFYIGLSAIVMVPIFKVITHLPPYVGMMFSLVIVATVSEIFNRSKISISSVHQNNDAGPGPLHKALSNIELPSILFFLGILMAVGALESLGLLFEFATSLNAFVPNKDIVILILGLGSSIIDNVPLVAASIGMFTELMDDPLWHFIAFSAGTGGSILIIGSAAGVVAMGMEKISFFWYLKKISWLAFIGFIFGSITFIIIRTLLS